jgi:hypothetical protein
MWALKASYVLIILDITFVAPASTSVCHLSGVDVADIVSEEKEACEIVEETALNVELLQHRHELVGAHDLRMSDLKQKLEQEHKNTHAIPAGFFESFSQAESTYTTEGLDSYKTRAGTDPTQDYGFLQSRALPEFKEEQSPHHNIEQLHSAWFHESLSGGPAAAWQTHFPAIKTSVVGNHVEENPWIRTQGIASLDWIQQYLPMPSSKHESSLQQASWFDNFVEQIDGFGRQKQPTEQDGRWYQDGWEERSVNTTLTCNTPGCCNSSMLTLFDAKTEDASHCRLSVFVHPTDYDQNDEREYIEFLKVNEQLVMNNFSPQARGCLESTVPEPLYPWVNALDVDKVVDTNGGVVIHAKNSLYVDECPTRDGNLLSAVAIATCMVRKKQSLLEAPPPPAQNQYISSEMLVCKDPGCTAETTLIATPRDVTGKKLTCTMDIMLFHTDFDGADEQVEFIEVGGCTVATNLTNGMNPCNIASSASATTNLTNGSNLVQIEQSIVIISNYDVTALAENSGMIQVRGKINDMVDDCPYQENLLAANVTIRCL